MCSRTNNFGNFGKKKPLTIASFSGFWNTQGQCSNWHHRFSCGQLHVCGSNYTSVWTQSPNTLSSISVPTLFLSFLFVACACVYICACDIKGARKLCGRYMISCKSRQCCSSFLSFVTFPSGNDNGKTVSFVLLSINSRQMKYFVLSH